MELPFDFSKLIKFTPAPRHAFYEILRHGRRSRQIGALLGILAYRELPSLRAVVIRFPDREVEVFALHEIAPVVPDAGISETPTPITA